MGVAPIRACSNVSREAIIIAEALYQLPQVGIGKSNVLESILNPSHTLFVRLAPLRVASYTFHILGGKTVDVVLSYI